MPSFVSRWTKLTFAGWALGFLLLLVFIGIGGSIGLGEMQAPIGLGMGLGVGFTQRRVIAERIGAGGKWVGATALGVTVPFLLRDVAKWLAIALPYQLTMSVVLAGLLVGVFQWTILRRHSALAGAWIPASFLGWALAASMLVVNERVLPKIPGIVGALLYIVVILVGGVLLGGVTAPVLGRILGAVTEGA